MLPASSSAHTSVPHLHKGNNSLTKTRGHSKRRKNSDFEKSFGFWETWNPSFRIIWKHNMETRPRSLYSRRTVKSCANSTARLTSLPPLCSPYRPRCHHMHPWGPHGILGRKAKIMHGSKSNIKLSLLTWQLVRNPDRKHVDKKTTVYQNFLKLDLRVWLSIPTFTYKSQAKWPRRVSRDLPSPLLSVRNLLHQNAKHRKNHSEYFQYLKADFLSFSLALGKVGSILYFKVLRTATWKYPRSTVLSESAAKGHVAATDQRETVSRLTFRTWGGRPTGRILQKHMTQ